MQIHFFINGIKINDKIKNNTAILLLRNDKKLKILLIFINQVLDKNHLINKCDKLIKLIKITIVKDQQLHNIDFQVANDKLDYIENHIDVKNIKILMNTDLILTNAGDI